MSIKIFFRQRDEMTPEVLEGFPKEEMASGSKRN
jgi:hypothetical protein